MLDWTGAITPSQVLVKQNFLVDTVVVGVKFLLHSNQAGVSREIVTKHKHGETGVSRIASLSPM